MSALPKGPRGLLRVTIAAARDPIGYGERLRRQYGDPFSYPDYQGKPVLVVANPTAIRSIFSAPLDSFESLLAERIDATLGQGSLLAISGPEHVAMRKLLMPPFHGQRMRLYGKQICDITLEQSQFQSGSQFVLQDLMHAISLQVIIKLVFGVTAPERVAYTEKLVATFRRAVTRAVLPIVIPWLRRDFWGFGPWARLQRAIGALRVLINEEIAQRRANPAERTDILSLLLAARHEDGTPLSDQQLFSQLMTLLFAGHETTATSLTFAMYRLSQEPEALARLHAELAELGPGAEPEALAKAPFLEAVCNETLRLYPVATGTVRKLIRSCEIAGYELPAGAGVIISILMAHRNPEVFPDPERFLPERFLNRTYSPFEFLPFGGGNRRCIGAAMAFYEMKLVLATLLSRHSFERTKKKLPRVIQLTGLELSSGLRMIVKPAPAR